MTRIPHTNNPVEVRQAFQRRRGILDVLSAGAANQVLIGAGVNIIAAWQDQTAIDHGSISGLGDDDHTIYILADGTRDLTGDLAVDALITIDGRDISVDGAVLDALGAIAAMVGVDVAATPGYLGAASNDGVLRTGTGITYTDGGDFVTLITNDSEIIHDSLSGYDANKHIDHTGVTLTAGSGLAGGGNISTGRSFDLDINSLAVATIVAGDFVPFWDITATATNKKTTFTNFEAALSHNNLIGYDAAKHLTLPNTITNVLSDHDLAAHTALGLFDQHSDVDHDQTTNYVANKHIDHTGVTLTAGSGLAGGGTIAANRTFDLDITGLALSAISANDEIPFYETTGGANQKITAQNLLLWMEPILIHDNLSGVAANEHIDWTNAASALLTSSTGQFAYTGVGIAPDAAIGLNVYKAATDSVSYGLNVLLRPTITDNLAIINYGLSFAIILSVSAGKYNNSTCTAIQGAATCGVGLAGRQKNLFAVWLKYGTGTLAAGQVDATIGFYLQPYHQGGTIVAAYDVYISAPVTGATVTNQWSFYNLNPADSYFIGQMGFGSSSPDARLEVETIATEGKQAITIDQNDADQVFIDFQGTSAANAANSITTWTAGNSIQGFVWVEINGVKKRMPYYDEPTS